MSDLNVNGALTRQRKRTLPSGRTATAHPVKGASAAGTASSGTAGFSFHDGSVRDRSLERPAAKNEKKKGRGEISDGLR